MVFDDNDMKERDMAQQNLILKVLTGSHLYGTNTPDSDKDYTGIFIPDKNYVLGLYKCEQVETKTNPSSSGHRNSKDDFDRTVYSLPKFIKLAAQNNPNILEIFFTPERNILYCNEFGKRLLKAVPFFVSKRVKHTFLGYAKSQKAKLLSRNYEGERVKLVEKYGYDVKFASHLIRLLHEGLELLETGKVQLPLANRDFIRSIKEGLVDLNLVLKRSDELEGLIKQSYETSKLPEKPDFEKLNQFQIKMIEDFWNGNY